MLVLSLLLTLPSLSPLIQISPTITIASQEGHIVPGIGDAGERLFNVHMSHDDDDASVVSNKKAKGGNGNA